MTARRGVVAKDANTMSDLARPIHTADPRASYLALKDEVDQAIAGVLQGTNYSAGPAVERFEHSFSSFVGCKYGVGVNSGTDALHLALRGCGIGQGDEVIAASYTSVATVAAIEMSGPTPVLVHAEPDFLTVDPAAVEGAISSATRAVIAVHLFGQPADLSNLIRICEEHQIFLIEDCAHSHGAEFRGRNTGSFGKAGCFSFFPTENLGGIGDGGMVVTDHEELAGRVRMLGQYGWDRPQHSVVPGWNSRLDPIQAAVLGVKLKHLRAINKARRDVAEFYDRSLRDLPIATPKRRSGCEHSFHLYVLRLGDAGTREALFAHLASDEVFAGVHYPYAVHQQPAYQNRLKAHPMPVTESLAKTALSLPTYPELTEQQLNRVVTSVRRFFS